MLKRKIIALLLSLSAALSLTTAAHAEDVTEMHRETVRVGNFDCWIEDGQYLTEYDGEVCLVINLNDISMQSAAAQQSDDWVETKDWKNGPEVDISDGHTYEGRINLTNGDDSTPIFLGKPAAGSDISYEISTKFVLPNTYNIRFYCYDSNMQDWYKYDRTVVFTQPFLTSRVLLSGTPTPYTTKCCIYFRQEGSGEKNFRYWFRQIFEEK